MTADELKDFRHKAQLGELSRPEQRYAMAILTTALRVCAEKARWFEREVEAGDVALAIHAEDLRWVGR